MFSKNVFPAYKKGVFKRKCFLKKKKSFQKRFFLHKQKCVFKRMFHQEKYVFKNVFDTVDFPSKKCFLPSFKKSKKKKNSFKEKMFLPR